MKRHYLAAIVSLFVLASPAVAAVSGEAIYQKRCSGCHDSTNVRIPPRDSLKKLPAPRILRALDFGVMMNVASPMTREEREAVAAFLGVAGGDAVAAPKNYCADRSVN